MLYSDCLTLTISGPFSQCVSSYCTVNISACISLHTKEEQRGEIRFLWQKVLKVLKFTDVYVLNMGQCIAMPKHV
jgi:hypothetical protein